MGLRKGPMIPVSDLKSSKIRVKPSDKISGAPGTIEIETGGHTVTSEATITGPSRQAGPKATGEYKTEIRTIEGLGDLRVVDTTQPPTGADVPGSWSRLWLGPGKPFDPIDSSSRAKDKEMEPRSFQYVTSVNSTLSPRISYGLMPFSDLRQYAESVPEVAMCIRLLTEELKSFVPTIEDLNGNKVEDPQYAWMTTSPDRFSPWTVWLSRFMYNVLVYDAGCGYMMRNEEGQIMGSRVIDGSTMFLLIDERGESPTPPAPAFTQVIWGVPKMFLNTYQIWYKPRHLRTDAPYGRSPIEDSLPAVKLLASLWEFEFEKYQIGNIPELLIAVPEGWHSTVEEILEFEENFNARMSGSSAERVRARFVPAGMEVLQTKEITFNQESYDAAANSVRLAYGIPQSEVGDSPAGGLGGSGYAEAMQSAFFRMGLAPLIGYTEGHFNDIIKMNGCTTRRFKLAFPPESLDPSKEEEKATNRFTAGLITRDEGRQTITMKPLGGDEGKYLVDPGKGGDDQGGGPMGGDGMPQGKPSEGGDDGSGRLPVTGGSGSVQVAGPSGGVRVLPSKGKVLVKRLAKGCGVSPEDDQYFGQPVVGADLSVEMPKQGANESYIVTVGSNRLPGRPAVWKPSSGEDKSLDDWIGGDEYRRAEAVYWMDRELAPDKNHYLVPVAFMDEIDGVPGSVQLYVPGPDDQKNKHMADQYAPEWIERAAVLDYITGQMDRGFKNWLTHPEDDRRPVLIDNDASFPPEEHDVKSSFVAAMAGKRLSDKTLESVYLVLGNYSLWQDIQSCLEDEQAVEAAKQRAQRLYNDKQIPEEAGSSMIAVSYGGGESASDGSLPSEVMVKADDIVDPDDLGADQPDEEPAQTGVMVAFFVPGEVDEKLMTLPIDWPDGTDFSPQDDYHVTLAFYGDISEQDTGADRLIAAVRQYAEGQAPITGKISGLGRFSDTDKPGMDVIYTSFDSPDLPDFRQQLVDTCDRNEFHLTGDHGFTPHITLAYVPKEADQMALPAIEPIDCEFKQVTVAWGGEQTPIDMGAPLAKADWEEDKHPRADNGEFGSGTGGGAGGDAPESEAKPDEPKAARPVKALAEDITASIKSGKKAPAELYGQMQPLEFDPYPGAKTKVKDGFYRTELPDGSHATVSMTRTTTFGQSGKLRNPAKTLTAIEGRVDIVDADGNTIYNEAFTTRNIRGESDENTNAANAAEAKMKQKATELFGIKNPSVGM